MLTPAEPSPAAALVGRAPELAQLGAQLARAADRHGSVVALVGEAGIGKSALAESFAALAAAQGFEVVVGRAWELSEAPAWFPVWPVLRALGLPAPPPPQPDGGFQLWHEVLVAAAAATARTPMVWILEDVHVADLPTLELLTFLARPAAALRLVVLVTLRPDTRGDPALERRLAGLRREAVQVPLAPLGEADIVRLVQRVAGRSPDANEARALRERTGGNPLFVVECARAPAGVVPASVLEVVRARGEALPEATLALVQAASVLGRDVSSAVLARMHGSLPATVIDALGPALRARLLVELEPGRFRFLHALVAESLLADLPAARRAALHLDAARALAGLTDTPERRVDRANHVLAALLLGAPGADPAVVLSAARALEAEGALDRALALEQQLLRAREEGLLPPPDLATLLRVSRLALAAGRFAESQRVSLLAVGQARDRADGAGLALAALAFGADLTPGLIDATLVRLLEEAIAVLPPGHPELEVRLVARLAAARQPAPDPMVPVEAAREAIRRARALGDDGVLTAVLVHGGAALPEFVDESECRDLAAELLAVAERRGDLAAQLRACARLAMACGPLGDFEGLDHAVDLALQLSAASGDPHQRCRPLLLHSMRSLLRGRFDESERLITEVQRLATVTDDPGIALSLYAHDLSRGMTLEATAALREALPRLGPALAGLPDSERQAASVRGQILARLGDAAGARAELARLPEAVPDSVVRSGEAELYAFAGSPAQRRAVIALLEPVRGRYVFSGHVPMTGEGPVERLIGLALAGLGEPEAALAELEHARAECERHGFTPWTIRCTLELGRLHRDLGHAAAAAAAFDAAGEAAERLGFEGLAERVRAERGEAPATAPASLQPPPGPTAATTPPLELRFDHEGDTWRLRWGRSDLRLRDSRGLALLARLVEREGEEIHVLTLSSDGEGTLDESDAGEQLDARARRAYRARLDALTAALDALVDQPPDPRRERALRDERTFLERELARATGLSGRSRAAGSLAERARVNVQRRIKDALVRIAEQDAALALHLQRAIRTGTWCTYRP